MIFFYFMYSLRTLQKYTSISVLYAIVMHFTFTYYYQLTLLFSLLSCVRLFGTSWTPGFPVLRYLLDFAQTHVHWVVDAIQPSHPLSPPSPPALNLSQHQSLFQSWLFTSGGHRIGASASVLPVSIQGWFPLGLTVLISLQSKGLSSFLQHHNLKGSNLRHSTFCLNS